MRENIPQNSFLGLYFNGSFVRKDGLSVVGGFCSFNILVQNGTQGAVLAVVEHVGKELHGSFYNGRFSRPQVPLQHVVYHGVLCLSVVGGFCLGKQRHSLGELSNQGKFTIEVTQAHQRGESKGNGTAHGLVVHGCTHRIVGGVEDGSEQNGLHKVFTSPGQVAILVHISGPLVGIEDTSGL